MVRWGTMHERMCFMSGCEECPCGNVMSRHGLKSHKKLHCQMRPDLVKARAERPPEVLPAVAPTFRPVPGSPFVHACPCGRNLLQNRMYMHAVACSWARQDGYEPPKERTNPCKCGCGGVVVSKGVKTASFLPGHYDRWVRAQYPEKKKREKPRPLAVLMRDKEREAMTGLEAKEAAIAAEAKRVFGTLKLGEASHRLWAEVLGLPA